MLMRRPRAGRRALLPLLAALAVVLPLGWMWASSFTPSIYSATDMGYVDAPSDARPPTAQPAGRRGRAATTPRDTPPEGFRWPR